MKRAAIGVAFAFAALSSAAMAEQPLVGIVSISATEANNARYIAGAQAAAKDIGWQVSVIDAAGNAVVKTGLEGLKLPQPGGP